MNLRKIGAIILILIMVSGLTACGKPATISINDGGVITEVEVKLPSTVEKILAAGDIQLGEEDQVNPSLDTKLSEAEEIVIARKHNVEITIAGSKKSASIVGGTIADLLKQEGITLTEKQKVNYDLSTPITEGMQIKISDMATVSIKCDGKTESKAVEAATVGDALKELGVTLGSDDRVSPEAKTEITDGMEITVDRVKIETETQKVTIEYDVEYVYDDSMSSGVEETRTSGQNGEKEVTFKVTYVNGEEEGREITEEKILIEPVNAVVAIGTYEAPVQESSSSSSSSSSSASSSSSGSDSSGGRYVVSQKAFYDCDGSGHGYYEIVYSDGTTEYVEF